MMSVETDIARKYHSETSVGQTDWLTDALNAGSTGLWKMIIHLDSGAIELSGNTTMLLLLGLEQDPGPEECYKQWMSRIFEEYVEEVNNCIKRIMDGQYAEVEYWWDHPAWKRICVRCGGRLVRRTETSLEIMGYHQEITELLRSRLANMESMGLLEEVFRDPETGLSTRRVFLERVDREIKKSLRSYDVTYMLLFHLRNYEPLVKEQGRETARLALRHVAKRLRGSIRGYDFCARYGTDIFAVLLEGLGHADIGSIVERIRQYCIEGTLSNQGKEFACDLCVGGATLTRVEMETCNMDSDEAMRMLMVRAEEALRIAREKQPSCSCLYALKDKDQLELEVIG